MPIASAKPARYPQEREGDVVLRDGSTVRVRPVRSDDDHAIRAFLEDLSPESIGFRFFGMPNLDWVTAWSLDVDYADRFALVAVSGATHAIIAHAAYIHSHGDRAEVAFLVADPWQGLGISTIMLGHLASIAEQHGITTFTAEVLPHNHRMIDVFRRSGFPVDLRSTPDAIIVEFPTSLSADALAEFEERDRRSAIAAVRSFLEPHSVAVIGASRRRETVGGEILRNLLAADFQGAVYAVNHHAEVVHSLPAYPSIRDVPAEVDLAVIVVPADNVIPVARDCADAGVRALLVISRGFAESGDEGARRQRELLAVCRERGMRLIGPNCLGVLNTAAGVHLNATFAPHPALPGRAGFLAQSGGLGIAIIEAAGRLGVGLSSFVSVGNKADLSGNDFLYYWEQDPSTELVLLYLESFGNPRRFARVAPRVARRKPVIAVKSGRSSAGAAASSSHTGTILSASDVTVDALFEQAGVIRTDTMHELFDVARLLASQPVPRDGRIAIVGNAGGPGVLCADACSAYGVEIQELPAAVQEALGEFLPASARLANPIDMVATATADDYRRTLRALIDADACDAIIVIYVPPMVTRAPDVASVVREVAESAPHITVAAVFMMSSGAPSELRDDTLRVPAYGFPEDAARAVAQAARHGRWLAREPGKRVIPPATHTHAAAAIISEALAHGAGWLPSTRATQLLDCYGLPLLPSIVVADADSAVQAWAGLGVPVALKASAPGLVHKRDAGGLALGLDSEEAVRAAVSSIELSVRRAGHRLDALILQPMAPPGVELIVGVVNDRSFGPVLACGAGGANAELIRDVAVRITPMTDLDADEMLRSLKTYPLLEGYRGGPKADIAAVKDVLYRVSAMVEDHPEIVELDCNPVIASPAGALIVDARVRIDTAPPPVPMFSVVS